MFVSTAVMAQENGQAQAQAKTHDTAQSQDRFKPRVYGSMEEGVKVQQTSVQPKIDTSDAELERVIAAAARARKYQEGGNVGSTQTAYRIQNVSSGDMIKADEANVPVNYAHSVKQGETLYNISKRYGVKVSDIQSANAISTSKISIGQVLVIPSQSKVMDANSVVTSPVAVETVVQAPDSTVKKVVLPVQAETDAIYAVLPKDTLYGISKRSCVKIDALAEANGIRNPNALKPGQKLVLPEGHCLGR